MVEEFEVQTIVDFLGAAPREILVSNFVEVRDEGEFVTLGLYIHLVAVHITQAAGNRAEGHERVILEKRIVVNLTGGAKRHAELSKVHPFLRGLHPRLFGKCPVSLD